MDGIIREKNNYKRERLFNEHFIEYINEVKGVSERNKEIVRKYANGSTYKELADEYKLSTNRIPQIIQQYITRCKKEKLL